MRVVEGRATIDDVDGFLDSLDDIGATHDVAVQAFDARTVTGRRHLERAVTLANRAHDRGEAIARDRAVEILLYAAGTRQIDDALALGVSPGDCPVAGVLDAGDGDADAERVAARDVAELLEETPILGDSDDARIREHFGIGDAELAATDGMLEDLVCERVALLVVER